MSSQINVDIFLKAVQLFEYKKWPIQKSNQTSLSLFDKFCERLKLFHPNHQEFIIELTKEFVKIGLSDYLDKFYHSLLCLEDKIIYGDNPIFLVPLVDPYVAIEPTDEKVSSTKTKSANFLHYMVEADDYTWVANNIIVESSIEKLKKNFTENSYLLLIDDYIGSGNTAIDVCSIFIKEIFDSLKCDANNLKVVCIAAQQAGVENVKKKLNIDVVSSIIVRKGISDYYSGADLIDRKEKMEQIEAKLKISEKYRFGYERTEGLITFMNKTPNNTFPVYWHETLLKVAPFPRYKNYKHNG